MEELARLERTIAMWLIIIGVAFVVFGFTVGDPFGVITGVFLIAFVFTIRLAIKGPSDE